MIRSFYENRLINSLSGGILFLFGKKSCPDSDESGVNRKKTVKKVLECEAPQHFYYITD